MNFLKSKIFLLISMFVLILFFSNDYGLIDIKKTAVIVALGVDYEEEKYKITAQVAIPQQSDTNSPAESAIIGGEGDTIAAAINIMGVRTGWFPKLSFCNLIIFGYDFVEQNIMDSINYFLRNERIPDTSILVVAEKKAKDILTSTTPLDSLSGETIQKLLKKDASKASSVTLSNIKDFSMEYHSKSKVSILPLIKKIETESESSTKQALNPQSVTVAASGQSQGQSQSDKKYVYDATTSLVFNEGKYVFTLTEKQTELVNIFDKAIDDATFTIKHEKDGKEKNITYRAERNNHKLKLYFENGLPVFYMKVVLVCKLEDETGYQSIKELSESYIVPDELKEALEYELKTQLFDLFDQLRESKCDLFGMKNKLYSFYFGKYDEFKDNILETAAVKVDINVKSFK